MTDYLATIAAELETSPDYKVLRRFVPRFRYHSALETKVTDLKVGVIADVESTGLDVAQDKIIEMALLPFAYDADGRVYEVGHGLTFFEYPGEPLREEIKALTGITDDMVRGQSINGALVAEVLREAVLVIAHHADFDRKMCERRIPEFAGRAWACSHKEVPWEDFGCVGAKLVHILAGAQREFYEAHRALDDARVTLHCLAATDATGRTALSYLLESARQPTARVWASGAPFESKDALKRRGYHWHADRKTWYRDVKPADLEAELAWVGPGAFVRRPHVDRFTAMDRYSVRAS